MRTDNPADKQIYESENNRNRRKLTCGTADIHKQHIEIVHIAESLYAAFFHDSERSRS